MKYLVKTLILFSVIFLLAASCSKENFNKSIAGTTWWAEESSSKGGTMHTEFTFTASSFSAVITFPFTPSYPPSRTTGTYTYEYPNIYLSCPDFTDVAVMDSDYKSFNLGNTIFLRK